MTEEENNHEEIENEEIELAKFGEKAIRGPRGGAFERLICQHLVLSVTSDPIDGIVHSCRAALSLPKETADRLRIDKQKVSDILTVALNFRTPRFIKDNYENQDSYEIMWSFLDSGEEGFKRYAEPWITTKLSFYLMGQDKQREEGTIAKMGFWQKFYYASRNLTVTGFLSLLNAFTSWAYPQIEELNQKVSSQVSPTTYSEILSMFTKFEGSHPP